VNKRLIFNKKYCERLGAWDSVIVRCSRSVLIHAIALTVLSFFSIVPSAAALDCRALWCPEGQACMNARLQGVFQHHG